MCCTCMKTGLQAAQHHGKPDAITAIYDLSMPSEEWVVETGKLPKASRLAWTVWTIRDPASNKGHGEDWNLRLSSDLYLDTVVCGHTLTMYIIYTHKLLILLLLLLLWRSPKQEAMLIGWAWTNHNNYAKTGSHRKLWDHRQTVPPRKTMNKHMG